MTRKSIFEVKEEDLKNIAFTRIEIGNFSQTISEQSLKNEEEPKPTQKTEVDKTPANSLTCRTCKITQFENQEQQHAHYKSDWHRFNLKLKLEDVDTISYQQFTELMSSKMHKQRSGKTEDVLTDSDDEKTDSDVSDEDEEDYRAQIKQLQEAEPEQTQQLIQKGPRVNFITEQGQQYSVFRSVLLLDDDVLTLLTTSSDQSVIVKQQKVCLNALQSLRKKTTWFIIMCVGGHFAAAIFERDKCVKHKTIHRYTTRRKQGGSQSSKDNRSATAPQSAGAGIRRYNEKKLKEEIVEIIEQWRDHIDRCSHIFYFLPGNNKYSVFNDTSFLKLKDERVQSVPFTTKRPTLVELQRIHYLLTSIEITEKDEQQTQLEQEEVAVVEKQKQTEPKQQSQTPQQQQPQQTHKKQKENKPAKPQTPAQQLEKQRKKIDQKIEQNEKARQQSESQLTDREKRAIAADRRLKPELCVVCSNPLQMIPLQIDEHRFCSVECAKKKLLQ